MQQFTQARNTIFPITPSFKNSIAQKNRLANCLSTLIKYGGALTRDTQRLGLLSEVTTFRAGNRVTSTMLHTLTSHMVLTKADLRERERERVRVK